jgi:SAM-dependent methyltransferase
MSLEGPAYYDDDEVFQTFMQRRHRLDGPKETLEFPVLRELIGEARGLSVLDLGCGDGWFGRELLENGALAYLGVDGSHNMVEVARSTLQGTAGQVVHADMHTWDYPPNAFDLAISLLALHYLRDLKPAFQGVFKSLKEGGRFIFSVEHPVITSCNRAWQSGGARQDWIVDGYFETGQRTTSWMGGQLVKYHRTVEDYFMGLQKAGFVVEHLRESRPQRERFAEQETYERRKRIPLFLFLAARKAGNLKS